MQSNEISLWFEYMPPVLEDYLFLRKDNEDTKLSSLDINEKVENL